MQSLSSPERWHRIWGSSRAAMAIIVYIASGSIARGADGVPGAVKKLEKSHQQATTIQLREPGSKSTLQDFCVNRDGTVIALLSSAPPIGAVSEAAEATSQPARSEVRILDAGGKLLRKWDVDFVAQAVNTGSDGRIYVGGNGRLAAFGGDGTLLVKGDAPQMKLLENRDELREHAKEQLEEEKASAAEQLKQFEEILKDPKQLDESQKQYELQLEEQAKEEEENQPQGKKVEKPARPKIAVDIKSIYEQQVKHLRSRKEATLEQTIASITSRLQQINAIAVGGQDVFIACPMSKGWGYAVWRMGRDFQEPKQIVTGLSGCCGQMDIQTSDNKLFVAENSRHRVLTYDREGKKLASFGKTDREGIGEGFSSCCNPMNLCFAADGALLASESNGVIKRFTADGKYLGLVGIAQVPEGCKNSAIGISSDGQHVYYIDIQRSNVIVLARDSRPSASE